MNEEKIEYGLLNDYMFRATLQTSETILRGLVCALLGIKDAEVSECVIENPIELGEDINDKTAVLDIKILLNNEKRLNIELQVANKGDWPDRSLYYACRAFSDLPKGGMYKELKPVIHIGIMGYRVFPDDTEFYSEYLLKNVKNNRVFNSKFSLRMLCLKNIENATEEERKTELYHWAKLFMATTWEEIDMLAEKSEVFKEVGTTIRRLSADEKIRLRCEAEEQIEHDKASAYGFGVETGRMEGRMEGLLEGEKLGYSKGEVSKLIHQVCKKLAKNKTIPEIADELEESEEAIAAICKVAEKYAPDYSVEQILKEIQG